ncbi:UBA/TS-N domain containing protein [Trichomonas vaginalis G3]|uniref:UBA/TS-N domain containing protein n=1 Tax=Trichomonas vaginalis (strain ATCC PRA-98 / G3) TaxID=412133 RepID=A2EAL3_TRIV3|nr:cilium movement [Trichomonas vaginalis G3]EAY10324.1 UBA/TS-N domain containing protein [Trichomonas vaginalis G3]KAI5491041.1 cilium movement [Trichomonas vaginalis G3]|eukprot:XP_001322547.1 UBA/TS-N domain containing protein [Trichomonas vaginalis G3]
MEDLIVRRAITSDAVALQPLVDRIGDLLVSRYGVKDIAELIESSCLTLTAVTQGEEETPVAMAMFSYPPQSTFYSYKKLKLTCFLAETQYASDSARLILRSLFESQPTCDMVETEINVEAPLETPLVPFFIQEGPKLVCRRDTIITCTRCRKFTFQHVYSISLSEPDSSLSSILQARLAIKYTLDYIISGIMYIINHPELTTRNQESKPSTAQNFSSSSSISSRSSLSSVEKDIVQMGFTVEQARAAVKAVGMDISSAISYIYNNADKIAKNQEGSIYPIPSSNLILISSVSSKFILALDRQVNGDKLKEMTDMGFSYEQSKYALFVCNNNLERAVDLITIPKRNRYNIEILYTICRTAFQKSKDPGIFTDCRPYLRPLWPNLVDGITPNEQESLKRMAIKEHCIRQ